MMDAGTIERNAARAIEEFDNDSYANLTTGAAFVMLSENTFGRCIGNSGSMVDGSFSLDQATGDFSAVIEIEHEETEGSWTVAAKIRGSVVEDAPDGVGFTDIVLLPQAAAAA